MEPQISKDLILQTAASQLVNYPKLGKRDQFLSRAQWMLTAKLIVVVLCALALKYFYANANVNELRWISPLRPGDDLMLDVDVTEARLSKSRPETGIVTFKGTVRNATGQALCEMVTQIIVSRRAYLVVEQAD